MSLKITRDNALRIEVQC